MNNIQKQKTCIIIARVSSKDQELEGYSLPSQEKFLTEYAHRLDFDIEQTFHISETASKKDQRKKFNEALKIALKKNIDILVFEKVDRVTRNLHSSVDIYNWLEADEKRAVHCVKDSLILHKYSKSQDKLNWDIKVAMAKNYSDNLSEEVRKGKKEKIEQGLYPGATQLGYKSIETVGSKRKIQVVNTDVSPFISKTFEQFATGKYSIETITKRMNDDGMRNRKGRKMTKSRMHELLRNPFYYGAFRWNNLVYQNAKHEAIITKELFDRVQQMLSRKPDAKYSKHFYMLKGLVRCGECGGTISWFEKKGHTYGRCNHHLECSQSVCGKEDDCDIAIKEALLDLKVQSPRLKEWIKNSLKEDNKDQEQYIHTSLDSLNSQLKLIAGKQSRLYSDRLDEIINLETFKSTNKEFEEEKGRISEQISKLNEDSNRYFQLGSLVYLVAQYADQIYEILEPEEISGVMKYIFGEITLISGKMQYQYKEAFKILKKAADITNKSSKMGISPESDKNIFEPLTKAEKSVQSELIKAVRSEIRRGQDSNLRSLAEHWFSRPTH